MILILAKKEELKVQEYFSSFRVLTTTERLTSELSALMFPLRR